MRARTALHAEPTRVLEHLATCPDGAPLHPLEQHFEVMRLQLAARIVRRLVDDGKVRKDGRRYFAIPSPVS